MEKSSDRDENIMVRDDQDELFLAMESRKL